MKEWNNHNEVEDAVISVEPLGVRVAVVRSSPIGNQLVEGNQLEALRHRLRRPEYLNEAAETAEEVMVVATGMRRDGEACGESAPCRRSWSRDSPMLRASMEQQVRRLY